MFNLKTISIEFGSKIILWVMLFIFVNLSCGKRFDIIKDSSTQSLIKNVQFKEDVNESLIPKSIYFFNHIHSSYSTDNKKLKILKLSPEKIVKVADKFLEKRNGLGFLTLTDHNSIKSFDDIKEITKFPSRVTAMRGIEWGVGLHLGIIDVVDNWPKASYKEKWKYEKMTEEAKDSNGLRVINHPRLKKAIWDWQRWGNPEAVEVWSTASEEGPLGIIIKKLNITSNEKALSDWVKYLEQGKKATALGGSDWHFLLPCVSELTMLFPVNIVEVDNNNPQTVKQAIKDGRVSIATKPSSPKIYLKAKWLNKQGTENKNREAKMGETLKGEGNLIVKFYADFSKSRIKLQSSCYNGVNEVSKVIGFAGRHSLEVWFFKSGETKPFIRAKIPYAKKNVIIKFETPIFSLESDLIRAELRRVNCIGKPIEFIGITNPIYLNY